MKHSARFNITDAALIIAVTLGFIAVVLDISYWRPL